jgi:hypothetical protein
VDFQSLKKILSDHSDLISSGWKEKFGNLTGPESLDPEDLKRFIRDHPNLFAVSLTPQAAPQAVPQNVPPAAQVQPGWPQPATE